MFVLPQPGDLGTYLGLANIDIDRAELLIQQAQNLALSVVDPLPDGAEAVIYAVAARAYTNPQNVVSETAGPMSVNFGSGIVGGLWLTRTDMRTLRRLGGGGGAFTIDTMPDGAGKNLPWWDTNANQYPGNGWYPGP